jgi:hypothetical protein
MKTATQAAVERMNRLDFRRRRSSQLLGAIMQEIGNLIPRDNTQELHDRLLELFMTAGVEIITDQDRREAGLEPRDEFGTTPSELAAIELRRLELLTKPLPSMLIDPATTLIEKEE